MTGALAPGSGTLYGAGGYFSGTYLASMVLILDGGPPIGLGKIAHGTDQFFGVIDTTGFTTFRFEETDSKVGQSLNVYADDFTFGIDGTVIFTCTFESGNTSDWSTTVP